MGRVFTIVFVFFAAWAGYWFVGSAMMRDAIEEWFAARQADGWVAEYADLGVAGFPSRFDATFDALELADPPEGWAWQGDRFQILSLAYNRSSVILAFPGEHRLATPRGALDLQGEPMRASLELDDDGAVVRLVGEGDDVRLSGKFGQARVTRLVLATQALGSAEVQRLGFEAQGTALDETLRAAVDPTGPAAARDREDAARRGCPVRRRAEPCGAHA